KMKKTLSLKITVFTLTGLFFLLLVTTLGAQEQPKNEGAVKFYVSPLKIEMPAAPGGTMTADVTILNQFPTPLTIKAYVMDFMIRENNSVEYYPPGYKTYSCANWITISEPNFTLAGNQEKKVALTLNVPKDAEPSGHYAVVFFESVGKPLGKETTGVITQGRIGTLVLQYTPGEEKKSGRITEFRVPKYTWSAPKNFLFGGAQSVPWRMVFENRGNVHINLESKVEILGGNGKSVYVSTPQRITVLPNTKRELSSNWDKAPTFGSFKAVLRTSYSDPKGGSKTEYKTITFYIVPVRALLITFVVIILGIVITILAYKFGKKRAARKAEAK
ncbi:hypothetical protein MUP06_01710, partial [Patescibacteria group bacterium]|nr:hypothetical protein [Patescibacteria group bacterium]